MENLSHSLVGAALAELALPANASTPQRRLFFWAGITAANLPDADLLYSSITPPPLGYLLHHRGHTHTFAGLIALASLIAVVCMLPLIRRSVALSPGRFWPMIAVALCSHIMLDWWNSYGVHPFFPVDMRWYYGDAVSIFEPWLWVILGAAATLNARGDRARLLLIALFAVLTGALGIFGLVPRVALAALLISAALIAWCMRRFTPSQRSAFALVTVVGFVALMFETSHVARTRAVAALPLPERGHVVDMVMSPQPGNPFCWTSLGITVNAAATEYALTRGDVAIGPIAAVCGSSFTGARFDKPVRLSLTQLQERARTDCRVRAWLQFGRAPIIGDGTIADYRFGGAQRGNFSALALASTDRACPAHLTNWAMPRADLLSPLD